LKSFIDPLIARIASTHAKRQYARFIHSANHARRIQERVLLNTIKRNADSEYGRRFHFDQIHRYADFVSRVPVQTYEDFRPYVQKVMDGQYSAMFGRGQRVRMFAMTSGSTDRPKYVPVTDGFLAEYRRGWNAFGVKALLDHREAILRNILQVVSPMDERRTHFGIPCGSISGLLAATQKRIVRKYYVTPADTAYIADPDARYYTIMRYAVPTDVSWMVTASPATLVKLARVAAQHADQLIRDIHDGTLNPPGEIPDRVSRSLMRNQAPDPATAARLQRVLDDHGHFYPRHFWNLAFLATWTGGTMALHLRDFPEYFGDIPVRDIGLLATEGRVSIPLNDGTPNGVLDVGGGLFEFLESGAEPEDQAAIRRCHELQEGCEYRVLMTTAAGFYRYDLGDYVRVHGMEGAAPIIEFLNRGEHASSITGEKLTEWQVTTAFAKCAGGLAKPVNCFVMCPRWDSPPHYRLYVEESDPLDEDFAQRFDDALSRINVEYASKRSSQRLGIVTIGRVPDGTLERIDSKKRAQRGTGNEQFKHRYLCSHPGDDAELSEISDASTTAA
jgi:hypothetical protein